MSGTKVLGLLGRDPRVSVDDETYGGHLPRPPRVGVGMLVPFPDPSDNINPETGP